MSRKAEAIYAADENIPKDPDPPAQLHNALSDSTPNRPPLIIPWTDIRFETFSLHFISSPVVLNLTIHRLLLWTMLMSKQAYPRCLNMSLILQRPSSAFSLNDSPIVVIAISWRSHLFLSQTRLFSSLNWRNRTQVTLAS